MATELLYKSYCAHCKSKRYNGEAEPREAFGTRMTKLFGESKKVRGIVYDEGHRGETPTGRKLGQVDQYWSENPFKINGGQGGHGGRVFLPKLVANGKKPERLIKVVKRQPV